MSTKANIHCAYKPLDKSCGDIIVRDGESLSGWRHTTIPEPSINHSGTCHWASPTEYGLGQAETERIFVAKKMMEKEP